MNVHFAEERYRSLETDPAFEGSYPPAVVKAFRKRMQSIRAAKDERDFYALKSLHYEKLKGNRQHERSMRLNDQYRLILRIEGEEPQKRAIIVGIEDYH